MFINKRQRPSVIHVSWKKRRFSSAWITVEKILLYVHFFTLVYPDVVVCSGGVAVVEDLIVVVVVDDLILDGVVVVVIDLFKQCTHKTSLNHFFVYFGDWILNFFWGFGHVVITIHVLSYMVMKQSFTIKIRFLIRGLKLKWLQGP